MTDERELSIEVRGMTCDHCERSVSKALQSVPGVKEVLEVSHAGAFARITAGPEVTTDRVERAVAKAGYRARGKDQPRPPESPAVISRGDGEFDLVILGGGSAGFAAAIKAADLGARVAMAEGGMLGGTCVNVGCVPSKTLIRAAEAQHRRVHHGFRGVSTSDGRPDWPTVRAEKDALVAELRQAKYWNVLGAYPSITLLQYRATLVSARRSAWRAAVPSGPARSWSRRGPHRGRPRSPAWRRPATWTTLRPWRSSACRNHSS